RNQLVRRRAGLGSTGCGAGDGEDARTGATLVFRLNRAGGIRRADVKDVTHDAGDDGPFHSGGCSERQRPQRRGARARARESADARAGIRSGGRVQLTETPWRVSYIWSGSV